MIFSFLKYLQPTWYFNLEPAQDQRYFPKQHQLEYLGIKPIQDDAYLSDEAKERDLSYSAFMQGYILREKPKDSGLMFWQNVALPVEDEYRFLRKTFNGIWVWYVLFIRLITLKNPVREFAAFFKTKNVKRVQYHTYPFNHHDYESFDSALIRQDKLVSVIIPTLNRYQYLKDVFKDLEKQTYKNFEVIVVDQTEAFDESVYAGWNLNLRFWYQKEKALWRARNEAIQAAQGEFILLYDDDSLVEEDWIAEHLKTMDYFNADLSSGVSISKVGGEVPAHYGYFRWSDQLDTGNVLIRKEVFELIGMFDRKFEKERMGDGEFGLRAYLAGLRNVSNPKAKRLHLKVDQGGLREMGSWDAFRPKSFWSPRPIPSVIYFFRKYFGRKATVLSLLKNVPPGIMPYAFKRNRPLLLIGALLSLLIWPFILWQVYRSWTLASQKLKNVTEDIA